MDIVWVARRQNVGFGSGDERGRVAIWDGVRTEDHGHHRTHRQSAGKTSTCDAVAGETEGHRAVQVHARMQGMPSWRSRNQAASTRRNAQKANIEGACEAGGGHDKPAVANDEDEQMQEARGDGRTEQSGRGRKNDEPSGTVENGNFHHCGSGTVQCRWRDRAATLEV